MNQPAPPPHKPAMPGTDLSLLGAEHVRVYRETGGETGYWWNGSPTLLMTTTGRKTGEPRTIAIIYTPVADAYILIASKGGSPTHPIWFLNIEADPRVKLQVKADRFDAVARVATSPEREALWAEAVTNWPSYDIYQSRTDRLIPVIVLERVAN